MSIYVNLEYTAVNPFSWGVAGHNFPSKYSTVFNANNFINGKYKAEVKGYNRLVISHKTVSLTYEYAVCYDYPVSLIVNTPSAVHTEIFERLEKIAMLKLARIARAINNLHW